MEMFCCCKFLLACAVFCQREGYFVEADLAGPESSGCPQRDPGTGLSVCITAKWVLKGIADRKVDPCRIRGTIRGAVLQGDRGRNLENTMDFCMPKCYNYHVCQGSSCLMKGYGELVCEKKRQQGSV